MSKSIDRAKHGPGWVEVILGAALSLILGVVLGAVLLILKPVVRVAEAPAEADRMRGTLYFVEGAKGSNPRQATEKAKAFVEGKSVTVIEGELNALAAAAIPPVVEPKPGQPAPAGAAAAAAPEAFLTPRTPNVRIREGVMQLGLPLTISTLGMTRDVIAQARGTIAHDGKMFVFKPDDAYLGSLPLQRIPFVVGFVEKKIMEAQQIPTEVVQAWQRLSNVQIEGNALKLTVP